MALLKEIEALVTVMFGKRSGRGNLLFYANEELSIIALTGGGVAQDLLQTGLDDRFESFKDTLLRIGSFRSDTKEGVHSFPDSITGLVPR